MVPREDIWHCLRQNRAKECVKVVHDMHLNGVTLLRCALKGNGDIQSERRSTQVFRPKPFPIRGSNGCDHG